MAKGGSCDDAASNLDPTYPLQIYNKDEITYAKVPFGRTCNICLDDTKPGDSIYVCQTCRKTFHKHCITEWLSGDVNATCPCCRTEVVLPAGIQRAVAPEPDPPQFNWAEDPQAFARQLVAFWLPTRYEDMPRTVALLNRIARRYNIDLATLDAIDGFVFGDNFNGPYIPNVLAELNRISDNVYYVDSNNQIQQANV